LEEVLGSLAQSRSRLIVLASVSRNRIVITVMAFLPSGVLTPLTFWQASFMRPSRYSSPLEDQSLGMRPFLR
jgi:hypothetical protein